MQFTLEKDTLAVIFSYLQIRDSMLVKAGTLTVVSVEYTSWGEEVTIFEGYPPLITGTHWGPTPFREVLQDVV